jgi:hypothetical protein
VGGGDLDVAQRDAGVEGGHDEPGAQHVGMDGAEAGASSDCADPAVGGATVEALAVASTQDRPLIALADSEVEGAGAAGYEGYDGGLVAFAHDARRAVPRCTARSSMLAPYASETRSPLRSRSTASAAWARSKRSAVNRNVPSSPRSMPGASLAGTLGRRTYWTGFDATRPSMWANR